MFRSYDLCQKLGGLESQTNFIEKAGSGRVEKTVGGFTPPPGQLNHCSNAFRIRLPGLFWTHNDWALSSSCSRTCTYFRIKYHLKSTAYLTHLFAPYTTGRSLQSQDKHLLLEPAVSTVTGSPGFSYEEPLIRNNLPLKIRNSSSFASFKRDRKTYYFSCTFP